jgi:hypothetical protein
VSCVAVLVLVTVRKLLIFHFGVTFYDFISSLVAFILRICTEQSTSFLYWSRDEVPHFSVMFVRDVAIEIP